MKWHEYSKGIDVAYERLGMSGTSALLLARAAYETEERILAQHFSNGLPFEHPLRQAVREARGIHRTDTDVG